jgi:hypothetical protein
MEELGQIKKLQGRKQLSKKIKFSARKRKRGITSKVKKFRTRKRQHH